MSLGSPFDTEHCCEDSPLLVGAVLIERIDFFLDRTPYGVYHAALVDYMRIDDYFVDIAVRTIGVEIGCVGVPVEMRRVC